MEPEIKKAGDLFKMDNLLLLAALVLVWYYGDKAIEYSYKIVPAKKKV